MGAGEDAETSVVRQALQPGRLIAQEGWILLNVGRNSRVMDASAQGAKEADGLTVGILPDVDLSRASAWLDRPIVTGLDSGRNNAEFTGE